MKKCSCGKIYNHIPKDAKKVTDPELFPNGYYYNCECKSTMFWPLDYISNIEIIQIIEWGKKKVA